jgi:hypothetical protein
MKRGLFREDQINRIPESITFFLNKLDLFSQQIIKYFSENENQEVDFLDFLSNLPDSLTILDIVEQDSARAVLDSSSLDSVVRIGGSFLETTVTTVGEITIIDGWDKLKEALVTDGVWEMFMTLCKKALVTSKAKSETPWTLYKIRNMKNNEIEEIINEGELSRKDLVNLKTFLI